MSFQARLDTIEDETGLTPRQFIEQARDTGFDGPGVKAGVIVDWLKEEHGLGRGHAMALVHVIRSGPEIDARHVGTTGTHRDDSATLWLDGKVTRPQEPDRRRGDAVCRRARGSRSAHRVLAKAFPDLAERAPLGIAT